MHERNLTTCQLVEIQGSSDCPRIQISPVPAENTLIDTESMFVSLSFGMPYVHNRPNSNEEFVTWPCCHLIIIWQQIHILQYPM